MKKIFKGLAFHPFKSKSSSMSIYTVPNEKELDVISDNSIVVGNGRMNLLLAPNVKIIVKGNFRGIIIGNKNNTVDLEGEFEGLISVDLLNLRKSSHNKGILFTNKHFIETGAHFSSRLIQGDLQNFHPTLKFDSIDIFQDDIIQDLYKESQSIDTT